MAVYATLNDRNRGDRRDAGFFGRKGREVVSERVRGRRRRAGTVFASILGALCLAVDGFSQQITDFNATFSYLCDDNYFNKGDSLLTFRTVGNTPLRMRRVRPPGWSKDKRLPALILIFGGGWGGDCAGEFKWMKDYFVAQGFAVFLSEYRLGAPIEQKAIPDSKAAVRWVRANADTLGVDPQKIITLGSSAGGHLAAAVGTVKGYELPGENLAISSRPNCIVSLWPVMDLTKAFSNMTSVDPKLVSPAWTLSDSVPPILVMTGGNDPYISGVRQFNTNAAAYKFERQYKEFPNAGHDFGFRPVGATDKGNAGEDSTISWSMAFLRQRGLTPAQVTPIARPGRGARALAEGQGKGMRKSYTVQGRAIRMPSSAAASPARSASTGAVAIGIP
jgi:acetyl esterase